MSNFAVNSYELKPEHLKAVADLFRDFWLGRTCTTHAVSVVEGYSDAVNKEQHNAKLRECRACTWPRFWKRSARKSIPTIRPSRSRRQRTAGKYLNPSNDTPSARGTTGPYGSSCSGCRRNCSSGPRAPG